MTSSMRDQFEAFLKDFDRECAEAEVERWKRKKRKSKKKAKDMPLDIRHSK